MITSNAYVNIYNVNNVRMIYETEDTKNVRTNGLLTFLPYRISGTSHAIVLI